MLTAHTELPVAAYRQSVLAAFQEVEDNLAPVESSTARQEPMMKL